MSLSVHKPLLEKYIGKSIEFIEDVIGPAALGMIEELRGGDILLLENVRILSEELIENPPEKQADTWLVRKLAPKARFFVFDGFAVAHRSQPSVVGFPLVLPSCMGHVMERELSALAEIWRYRKQALLIVGGAKVPESLRAIKETLDRGLVDKVLVGGLVGVVFSAAKEAPNAVVRNGLERQGLLSEVERARGLLERYKDAILLPADFRSTSGSRSFKELDELPGDIGDKAVGEFTDMIRNYEVVIITGPMGKIEDPLFSEGTLQILKAAASRKGIIGGGHTIMAAERAGVIDKLYHVSTGGRAFLMAFSEELPALRALIISAQKFWR
ncbi:phosphoglycerate kinase [Thermoproteus tenax Kra 1]|uniref:Phosphoglycerate kinase n=2 Tax=Thermoproteus tenax TaxID=2271 RepID=G4RKR6_THETK|nr:phosphoglycerate kinase [Thermoproteus tenax Kra 1]